VPQQPGDVETVLVHRATRNVAHRNDLGAVLGHQQPGEVTPDVAESLNHHPAAGERNTEIASVFFHDVHHSPTRRFLAPERASEGDGLAGHDGRRVAMPARVFVEQPSHHLGVGVHVGCGDVTVGTEHDGDPLGETSREPLQLEPAQLPGVDRHAAFGAAEGNVEQGRLPRHDRGETQDLVLVGVRVVADAAFARPARSVVLNAVSGEHLDAPVVHPHGDLDRHLAERLQQDAAHVRVQIDQIGGPREM